MYIERERERARCKKEGEIDGIGGYTINFNELPACQMM